MHLHCHSWFSLRYGLMQPRELLAEAQTAGITALALTDINATSAHWDFVRDTPNMGFVPSWASISATPPRTATPPERPSTSGMPATTPDMPTCARTSTPTCTSTGPLNPWRPPLSTPSSCTRGRGGSTRHPLRSNEYIGVRPWEQAELRLLEGAADVPHERLIALHTFTFRHKRDWNCHRILRAVDRNELLSKLPETATGHPYDRLLSPADFHQAFAEHAHWVERSEALLNACEIALPDPPDGRSHNNQHTYTESEDEDEQLIRALCAEGLAYRYPDHEEHVIERMEMELAVIRQQGYLAYFLINWDITSYARSRGYFMWDAEAEPTASSPTCCASRT